MQIRDTDSALLVAQLLFLEAEETSKPIHLYINSPGGSVTAGLAIYDTVSAVVCLLLEALSRIRADAGQSVMTVECRESELFLRLRFGTVCLFADTYILCWSSVLYGVSPTGSR